MHSLVLNLAELSAGLLVARLALGLLMAAHGSQKLFGWFGGHGIAGTGAYLETLGYFPGRTFATIASTTEVISGLLIALGFLGPIGPALMVSVMIVAAVTVHLPNGLFATKGGIELPLIYALGAVALALTGFGAFSVDAALGLQGIWTPALSLGVLAIGILGGVGNLLVRRPRTA
ncbi:MAG: DoxX family protein [Stellaceae bacterium]